MLDKPFIPGFLQQQQPRYQPVTDCTCWTVYVCLSTLISSRCHINSEQVILLSLFIMLLLME